MAGYGDDAGLDAWLLANGYTWPAAAGTPTKAQSRQRGSAYVDGLYGLRFPGTPAGGLSQERAWPRADATSAFGASIGADEIPAQVIEASYAAAYYEAQEPGALAVASTGLGAVKREKVGAIETEYFEGSSSGGVAGTPVLSAIEGLLGPILGSPHLPYPLVV